MIKSHTLLKKYMAQLSSSENFDEALLHFESFNLRPFSLPHIGNQINENAGVLFIMESHYTDPLFFPDQYDKANLKVGQPELFYNIKSKGLTEAFKACLNTRKIISDSKSSDPKIRKGKSVYRKLAAVVKDGLTLEDKTKSPLEYVGIYNYFLRPSYKPAATIKLCPKDEEVAYDALKHILRTVNISKIIFTSAKAYDSFRKKDIANNKLIETGRKIYRGTHPRVWGNKCTYEAQITWREWVINMLRTK